MMAVEPMEWFMKVSDDGGGQAFPSAFTHGDGTKTLLIGMTLRDWFAGQALMGLCRDRAPGGEHFYETMTPPFWQLAQDAYRMADAMLAERNKIKAESE